MSRIDDKLKDIKTFIEDLKEYVPETFEEYSRSKDKKAICERYFEKIIEAITDIAFLIIKEKKLEIPQDDYDAFNVLMKNKIINEALAIRLKQAKGMRNIIVHAYGEVDDEKVYEAVTEEIEDDTEQFIEEIKKVLK